MKVVTHVGVLVAVVLMASAARAVDKQRMVGELRSGRISVYVHGTTTTENCEKARADPEICNEFSDKVYALVQSKYLRGYQLDKMVFTGYPELFKDDALVDVGFICRPACSGKYATAATVKSPLGDGVTMFHMLFVHESVEDAAEFVFGMALRGAIMLEVTDTELRERGYPEGLASGRLR